MIDYMLNEQEIERFKELRKNNYYEVIRTLSKA